MCPADVFKFSNQNIFCRLKTSVRGKDVFIIQPVAMSYNSHGQMSTVNDNLMELLIMIDTAKRDSAGRITAVVPYYGYGRTDKKDQPRVPITARLVADLISVAGADRFLTMDLHAGQIQGFAQQIYEKQKRAERSCCGRRHWRYQTFAQLCPAAGFTVGRH
jgi:ribose-phosphate pyrophosphokinase